MDTSAEIRVALEEASRGVGRGAWATLLVGANAPTYVKHLLCLQKRLREVGSIYPLLVPRRWRAYCWCWVPRWCFRSPCIL